MITRGKGGGGKGEKGKGVKYMVMEADLTLGGEHIVQYVDDVLLNFHLKPI